MCIAIECESETEWMRCTSRGDWEAAWRISDRVLRTRGPAPQWYLPRHLQPVWDGRPLTGRRVLVRCCRCTMAHRRWIATWTSSSWSCRTRCATGRPTCLERFPTSARAAWHGLSARVPTTRGILSEVRVLRGLDLLVTVDTLSAHLAGALGVPVWMLLPARADWRWMDGEERTPWYPTMRLWRQHPGESWEPPLERLHAALARLC